MTGRPLTSALYECDECGSRFSGSNRCEMCGKFARKVASAGKAPVQNDKRLDLDGWGAILFLLAIFGSPLVGLAVWVVYDWESVSGLLTDRDANGAVAVGVLIFGLGYLFMFAIVVRFVGQLIVEDIRSRASRSRG